MNYTIKILRLWKINYFCPFTSPRWFKPNRGFFGLLDIFFVIWSPRSYGRNFSHPEGPPWCYLCNSFSCRIAIIRTKLFIVFSLQTLLFLHRNSKKTKGLRKPTWPGEPHFPETNSPGRYPWIVLFMKQKKMAFGRFCPKPLGGCGVFFQRKTRNLFHPLGLSFLLSVCVY